MPNAVAPDWNLKVGTHRSGNAQQQNAVAPDWNLKRGWRLRKNFDVQECSRTRLEFKASFFSLN